jgi:hypothetical protein
VSAGEHGYSGKPLAAKLGVREDDVLALFHAPTDISTQLAPLPLSVDIRSDLRRAPNVEVAFYDRAAAPRIRLPALRKALYPDRALWIAWPKQASGVQTDLNGNGVRTLGIEHALVDTKVADINETRSGLKLVVPVKLRDSPN